MQKQIHLSCAPGACICWLGGYLPSFIPVLCIDDLSDSKFIPSQGFVDTNTDFLDSDLRRIFFAYH